MSKVHVYAEHIDYLEQTKSVLSDCAGTFDGVTVCCPETEPFHGQDEVHLEEERIVLVHDGDTKSRIELPKNGIGTARIQTPYGEMHCSARLLKYERNGCEVYVEYVILQGSETVSHIGLRYRFAPLD